MLEAVGSDLDHAVHINIFLKTMTDFEAMNTAYAEVMGAHRPARTVVAVSELPKPGVLADHEPDGGHTDVERQERKGPQIRADPVWFAPLPVRLTLTRARVCWSWRRAAAGRLCPSGCWRRQASLLLVAR